MQIPEAVAMLSGIDRRVYPEVSQYLAFCHMNQWNYEEAIPLLKTYLGSGPDPYKALVTEVNLASALVLTNRYDEAVPFVERGIAAREGKNYSRLLANWRELRAQIFLAQDKDKECGREISRALALIGGQSTNDQLYLLKWLAVLEARGLKSPEPLLRFREEALGRNDFECVREADLQVLKIEFTQQRFRHLIFGTPWKYFRRRAPQRVGALFSQLFSGEHYHYLHSPNRVHQLIWRARGWIKSQGLPMTISEREGRFSLQIDSGFGIYVALERAPVTDEDLRLDKLRDSLPPIFSARDAQQVLQASEPTVRRLIQSALKEGKLQKLRAGSRITYKRIA